MFAGNLEYIISSLPHLSFSAEEQLQNEIKSLFQKYASAEEASGNVMAILNTEAEKYLSARDFKNFQDLQLIAIHQDAFQKSRINIVAEFSRFMFNLKDELKTYRLAQKTEEVSAKTNFEWITDLSENPLTAELQLMQLQWNKLEALSQGHYANFSALILYKLKLQLLLRWWSFDMKTGFAVFQKSLNVA
jgi:hypothetical protein